MRHEASSGGVVVREGERGLEMAVIRPRGRLLWALPKGHVHPGETREQTAQREVLEETGLSVRLEGALGEIHYIYTFRGVRISKHVHFFLFRYEAGTIDDLEPAMRVEVEEARWVPLVEAPALLAYRGEKAMAARAVERLLGPGPPPPSTRG
jgi:8-oxo-dGTP pyrophosphatase MutT (NUDIX family)